MLEGVWSWAWSIWFEFSKYKFLLLSSWSSSSEQRRHWLKITLPELVFKVKACLKQYLNSGECEILQTKQKDLLQFNIQQLSKLFSSSCERGRHGKQSGEKRFQKHCYWLAGVNTHSRWRDRGTGREGLGETRGSCSDQVSVLPGLSVCLLKMGRMKN